LALFDLAAPKSAPLGVAATLIGAARQRQRAIPALSESIFRTSLKVPIVILTQRATRAAGRISDSLAARDAGAGF